MLTSAVRLATLPVMQKVLWCTANGRWLKDSPVPTPRKPNEVLIRNAVVASNPKGCCEFYILPIPYS
jgi:hypothetical protein